MKDTERVQSTMLEENLVEQKGQMFWENVEKPQIKILGENIIKLKCPSLGENIVKSQSKMWETVVKQKGSI